MVLACAGTSAAQVSYSFNFDLNATGWTGNFTQYTGATACGATGGAVRRNLYSGATTGSLISPLTGASIGGNCTITFDYKVNDWSANTVGTAAPWGTVNVQYGATATGPWTTFATFSNEAQTTACINKSFPFNPPAGPLYIQFSCAWAGGDAYWNFDNVNITETATPCSGTPAPGNTVGPTDACAGGSVTLSLQNATSGVGVGYQWFSSTVSSSGPWTALGTASTQVSSQSVGTWYYCAVTCSSNTGNSAPLFVPMATATFPQSWSTGVVAPNCWSASAPVGVSLPFYSTASGYGLGTGSVEYNFYSITSPNQLAMTSPVFTALPGGALTFDVAGCTFGTTYTDQIAFEESNDGGLTWTTIATLDNSPTGLLNTIGGTGILTGSFVPTAAQWATRTLPLAVGTNRIRARGISGFGNNVYLDNVNVTIGTPAHHTVYGSGCYEIGKSFYQQFADAALGSAALQGNTLLLIPSGAGYTGNWLPGTAGAFYVAPSGTAATVFATASDDGTQSITLANPFFTNAGPVSALQIDANGVISLGAAGTMGFTPSGAGFTGNTFPSFAAWHDYNEAEVGSSGRIKYEEIGGVLYVTWDAVENYSTTNPATSTVQFQFDLAAGNVTIVFQSISTDTTSTYNSIYLVGWSGGSAIDHGSKDLATALPYTTAGTDIQALTLSASPTPINNGPAVTYTVSNIPEFIPTSGIYVAALFASTGSFPGLDLGFLGAPGCSAYISSLDIGFTMLGASPTSSVSIPFSTAIVPVSVYFQAIALFDPAFPLPNGQNAFGMTTSNGLESYIENF